MGSIELQPKLPAGVVDSVRAVVYSYGASLSSLTDETMLLAIDYLAPHYPLSEEEDAASLTLREYLLAGETLREVHGPLQRLHAVLMRTADMWSHAQAHWERYERHERRHPEGRESHVHRELRYEELPYEELPYEMRAGDPRALQWAVERAVAEALRRAGPAVGRLPEVVIPPELVMASKDAAESTHRILKPYAERVAPARHALSRYLYRIVAVEGITADKS